MNQKKFIILLLLLFIVLAGTFYFINGQSRSPSMELLTPKIEMPKKALIKELTEVDINEIIESIKDNEKIPKGIELPEYTPSQARPARHYFNTWMLEAKKIVASENVTAKELLSDEKLDILNGAFRRNGSPRYLKILVDQMLVDESLSLDQYLKFVEVLRIQRYAVSSLKSDRFILLVSKIKKAIVEKSGTKNPLLGIQLLYLAYSLPLPSFQEELLLKLQPLVVQASFSLKSSDVSLSADESTLLSKRAIELAWAFQLQKKTMPNWLSEFIEKEACRLAYRLEQDGCLPVWQKDIERINLNEYIYKAAQIFNRVDLRYIGLNGLQATHSYPPDQLNYDFSDIDILVVRTGWNHASTTNRYEPYQNEELQITYDMKTKMISLSLGVLTQFVFHCPTEIKSVDELKHCFELLLKKDGTVCSTCKGIISDYEVVVKNVDLVLASTSIGYIVEGDAIKSHEFSWLYNGEIKMKSSFEVEFKRNEKFFIKSIIFNTRR